MRSRLSRRARATACSTRFGSDAIPVIGGVLPDVLPFCHCGALARERQRLGGEGVTKRMMRNWGRGGAVGNPLKRDSGSAAKSLMGQTDSSDQITGGKRWRDEVLGGRLFV